MVLLKNLITTSRNLWVFHTPSLYPKPITLIPLKPIAMKETIDLLARIQADISSEKGISIIATAASANDMLRQVPVLYTVGMYNLDLPELILAGLNPTMAQDILYKAKNEIIAKQYCQFQLLNAPFMLTDCAPAPLKLFNVSKTFIGKFSITEVNNFAPYQAIKMAMRQTNKNPNFLLLGIPDKNGNYQDEPGYGLLNVPTFNIKKQSGIKQNFNQKN